MILRGSVPTRVYFWAQPWGQKQISQEAEGTQMTVGDNTGDSHELGGWRMSDPRQGFTRRITQTGRPAGRSHTSSASDPQVSPASRGRQAMQFLGLHTPICSLVHSLQFAQAKRRSHPAIRAMGPLHLHALIRRTSFLPQDAWTHVSEYLARMPSA